MPALLIGLGVTEILENPEMLDPRADDATKDKLRAAVEAAFASRTLTEWKTSGDLDGTFFSPLSNLPEVATDPQVIASGAYTTLSPGPHDGP